MARKKAELPKSIKVLGKPWRVILTESAFGTYTYGATYARELKMEIHKDQPPLQELDTVIHELIHVVEDTIKLEFSEKDVHGLAAGLVAILVDNPELVEYIREKVSANTPN